MHDLKFTLYVGLILSVALTGGFPAAASPQGFPGSSKVSADIFMHREEKKRLAGVRGESHARILLKKGLNPNNLNAEDCALYVSLPLTSREIAVL